MYATVITDASFCLKHRVGGWAIWVKCSKGVIKKSGCFKSTVNSSLECEIKAIIIGMRIANKYFDITRFHVVTDCLAAIDKYRKKQGYWGEFYQFMPEKAKVTFAHVKAHEHTDTPRNYINAWCDTEAKKHMKAMRLQHVHT